MPARSMAQTIASEFLALRVQVHLSTVLSQTDIVYVRRAIASVN